MTQAALEPAGINPYHNDEQLECKQEVDTLEHL